VRVVRPAAGAGYVLKDVSHTNPLWRPIGRWLLRREEKVLRRIEGLAGVPRLLARVDADALALEELPGRPLNHETARSAPPGFFDDLARLVERLHGRGVVHLDLRQKRNVLVGPDGAPRIVDFGAAVFPPRFIAGCLRAIDRSAVTKFRLKYRPDTVGPAERERHRVFERVRRLWFVSRMRKRRPGA
jgi:RIO-like serine/threonine protein kinase